MQHFFTVAATDNKWQVSLESVQLVTQPLTCRVVIHCAAKTGLFLFSYVSVVNGWQSFGQTCSTCFLLAEIKHGLWQFVAACAVVCMTTLQVRGLARQDLSNLLPLVQVSRSVAVSPINKGKDETGVSSHSHLKAPSHWWAPLTEGWRSSCKGPGSSWVQWNQTSSAALRAVCSYRPWKVRGSTAATSLLIVFSRFNKTLILWSDFLIRSTFIYPG